MPLMTMLRMSSTTNAMPGSRALLSHRLAITRIAMMIAIQNRIVLAGSEALTSV